MKLYMFIGVLVATYILIQNIAANAPWTISERVFGAIMDVFTWPIVVIVNILQFLKGR